MFKTKFLAVFLLFGILFSNCNKDNTNDTSSCDQTVLISASEYSQALVNNMSIISLEIEDDCLIINFGASGCDGNSWELKLIDSGGVMESYPEQRNLKFFLNNEEACLAYFTKEISFDISDLQIDSDKIYLNIQNNDQQLLYDY